MAFVGIHLSQLTPALVVEFQDQLGIFTPTFGRGHLHNVVVFPQAIFVPKGRNPALGRHPGATQYHDIFFHNPKGLFVFLPKLNNLCLISTTWPT